MKKHNDFLFFSKNYILFSFYIFISVLVFFTGCTSVPKTNTVHPLDVLDKDCSLFVSIPIKENEEPVKQIVMQSDFMQKDSIHLEEKDIDSLLNHLNRVYIGLKDNQNATSKGKFQIAAECNIPAGYLNVLLTKKKGWSKNSFTDEKSKLNLNYFSNEFCSVCIPYSGLMIVSDNILPLLENYSRSIQNNDNEFLSERSDDIGFAWLTSSDTEITFYTEKTKEFLGRFTGTKFDLKMSYIKGTVFLEQLKMNLHLAFNNDKYLKAAKSMLTFVFGSAAFNDFEITDNELIIKQFEIEKETISSILITNTFGGN